MMMNTLCRRGAIITWSTQRLTQPTRRFVVFYLLSHTSVSQSVRCVSNVRCCDVVEWWQWAVSSEYCDNERLCVDTTSCESDRSWEVQPSSYIRQLAAPPASLWRMSCHVMSSCSSLWRDALIYDVMVLSIMTLSCYVQTHCNLIPLNLPVCVIISHKLAVTACNKRYLLK